MLSPINIYMKTILDSIVNIDQFHSAKYDDIVEVVCAQCSQTYKRKKRDIKAYQRRNLSASVCKKCQNANQKTGSKVQCPECGKSSYKPVEKISKGYIFCNATCSTTYNNKHKDYGYRRSKLEKWIEDRLIQDFPILDIHFNSKQAIESELDIYIPALRLGIELNGIFHYEPIYSPNQFKRIQNNDQQKIIECYKRGIELCVIDTSTQKYFSDKTSEKYYAIVTNIINRCLKRLEQTEGIEPPTGLSPA